MHKTPSWEPTRYRRYHFFGLGKLQHKKVRCLLAYCLLSCRRLGRHVHPHKFASRDRWAWYRVRFLHSVPLPFLPLHLDSPESGPRAGAGGGGLFLPLNIICAFVIRTSPVGAKLQTELNERHARRELNAGT